MTLILNVLPWIYFWQTLLKIKLHNLTSHLPSQHWYFVNTSAKIHNNWESAPQSPTKGTSILTLLGMSLTGHSQDGCRVSSSKSIHSCLSEVYFLFYASTFSTQIQKGCASLAFLVQTIVVLDLRNWSGPKTLLNKMLLVLLECLRQAQCSMNGFTLVLSCLFLSEFVIICLLC